MCRRRKLFGFLFFLILFSQAIIAQETGADNAAVPKNRAEELYRIIQGLLHDELHDLALKQIDLYLEAYPEGTHAGELRFLQGKLAFSQEAYEKVIQSCTAYLQRAEKEGVDPADERVVLARTYLGLAHAKNNQEEQAGRLLRDAIPRLPSSILKDQALEELVAIYQRAGQFQEAASLLEAALEEKDNADMRATLAEIYLHQKKFRKAWQAYEVVAEHLDQLPTPRQHSILLGMARVAFFLRRFDETIRLLEQPGPEANRDRSLLLSWAYYEKGEYAKAYDLMKGVTAGRGGVEPFVIVDRLLLEEDFRQAVAVLEAELAAADESARRHAVHKKLADVYAAFGDRTAEVRHLEQAIEEGPKDALPADRYRLSHLLYLGGDYSGAETVLQKLIAQDPGSPLDARAHLLLAKTALARRAWTDGARALSDFVKTYEKSPLRDEAYYLLGMTLAEMERPDEAIEILQVVIEKYPTSTYRPSALYRAGTLLERVGRDEEAISRLRVFLQVAEKSERKQFAYSRLLSLYQKLERYEERLRFLEQLPDDFPVPQQEQILAKGQTLYPLGRYDEALALLQALEKEAQSTPRVWYWMALCLRAKGDLQEADSFFSRVIQMAPRSAYAPYASLALAQNALRQGRGEDAVGLFRALRDAHLDQDLGVLAQMELEKTFLSRGDFKSALEGIPEFVQADPTNMLKVDELLAEADELFQAERYDRAEAMYRTIVTSFPREKETPSAADRLGEMLYQKGEFREAAQLSRLIVEEFQTSEFIPGATVRLANSLFQLHEYEGAIEQYRRAIELEAEDGTAFRLWYLLGLCFEELGLANEAIPAYEQFLDRRPKETAMVEERIRLVVVFQQADRFLEAIKIAKLLLDDVNTDDQKAELNYYIGESHVQLGQNDDALVSFLAVTYLHPDNALWANAALFKAGEIYEQHGRLKEALALFKKLVTEAGNDRQGAYAKERVAEIERRIAESESARP